MHDFGEGKLKDINPGISRDFSVPDKIPESHVWAFNAGALSMMYSLSMRMAEMREKGITSEAVDEIIRMHFLEVVGQVPLPEQNV